MKVFVTGATGLLGNNLVRALEQRGHEVVGLVRSTEKARRLLDDTGMTPVPGDMRKVAGFAAALDGCEVVFHTAAYFREYYQPGDHAAALDEINVRGTLALMEAADRCGVRRFVHVSSGGTIGRKSDGSPGDEDTPPSPVQLRNLYFRSKVAGDAAIRAWRPLRGMETMEILPGWMWGPGDAAPTAAGQAALDFLAGKIPGLIDGGTCVVDARDVAETMIAAAERGRPGERYLVGGMFQTMEEIMQGLSRVTGRPAPRLRLPFGLVLAYATAVEIYGRLSGRPVLLSREAVRTLHARIAVTSAKAERELGTRFRPLDETMRDVVAWYRTHPAAALARAA